jgi:hypothetical protein
MGEHTFEKLALSAAREGAFFLYGRNTRNRLKNPLRTTRCAWSNGVWGARAASLAMLAG